MPRSPVIPVAVQGAVLDWFATHGRAFPIRAARDPYAILVSEVMAQQTQIHRAQEYWTRWMAAFPTVERLAEAAPATVLRAWGGLGYNRRAISLHRAAKVIVERHGGAVPETVDELERLPGVGPYTARAVAAIAFGRRVGAVDTNVRRVLSRLVSPDGVVTAASLQSLADAIVPPHRAREWTHAVMDVGATFCRPRRPRCDACPVRPWCRYASVPAERRERRPAPRNRASAPFASTTRWLRGQLLARARGSDTAWTTFDEPVGDHPRERVRNALAAMARDGLVELDPLDDTRVRLPTR